MTRKTIFIITIGLICLLLPQASFSQDTDEQYVFVMLTLVNGTQVRLARDKDDHSLWTIEYIGYAL